VEGGNQSGTQAGVNISSDPRKIAQNYKKMEDTAAVKKTTKNEQAKTQNKQAGDNKAQKRKGHE